MSVYTIIMSIGAVILLIAQFISQEVSNVHRIIYDIMMIVGLVLVILPPIINALEIIRYQI